MELLDQKLRKHFVLRQHVLSTVCLARRLLSSKAHETQQSFQLSNLDFRRFLMEVSIFYTMEIYNEAAIFRRVQTRHTAMLEKKVTEIEADSYI